MKGPFSLSGKVAFLSDRHAYRGLEIDPVVVETHMSWVFLAGDRAFKLKKPVRFPYLDYSTLLRRKRACRAEADLNRRLAPAVYLGVVPLRISTDGYSIGGHGKIIDWLVAMRRLDSSLLLDQAIVTGSVDARQIDSVATMLARFYKTAGRFMLSPDQHRRKWLRDISDNRAVLFHSGLPVAPALLRRVDRIQRRILSERARLFEDRVRARRIVDGHGDLRPEHVWLGHIPQVIDCIEFNKNFRAVDPFDEIAFLSVECERLGASWIGKRIAGRIQEALHDCIPEALYSFYRCYRATLRARLTIAHLLEPYPRNPAKWPGIAQEYLSIAEREALWLEDWLSQPFKRPPNHQWRGHDAAGKWIRPAGPSSATR